MAFDGFAVEAFTFYQRLEADNSGEFWQAHRGDYERYLVSRGFAIGGDQLKTTPRGVPADHPRAGLMRHRSLTASRDWPIGPALETRDSCGLIQQTWRQLIPLCDWLGDHVGGSQAPGRY